MINALFFFTKIVGVLSTPTNIIEPKLLKALYSKNNKGAPYAPKTHDLLYLAEKLNIELTEEQEITLNEITTFNLSTRYDDYKREFYNKCTDEYTEEQINKIKEVKTWLEIMLK